MTPRVRVGFALVLLVLTFFVSVPEPLQHLSHAYGLFRLAVTVSGPAWTLKPAHHRAAAYFLAFI